MSESTHPVMEALSSSSSSSGNDKKANPGNSEVKVEGEEDDNILLPKPFLIPEIAEKILGYLADPEFHLLDSLENLKQCAGVCPLWKSICTRSRGTFDEVHLTFPSPKKNIPLDTLLAKVPPEKQIFYLHIHSEWCPEFLKTFIEAVGSQIGELNIWFEKKKCYDTDSEEEEEEDSNDNNSSDQNPELDTLQNIDKIVSFLTALNDHAPNLRSLRLTIETELSGDEFLPYGFNFPPSTKFEPPSLQNLNNITLSLKKLAVSCEFVEYLDLFTKIVDSCPLLEKLEIGGEMYSVQPLLEHLMKDEEKFSRLKELDVEECASRDLSRAPRFTVFYFAHSWPLESLKLSVENNAVELVPWMLTGDVDDDAEQWAARNCRLKELTLSFGCFGENYPRFNWSLSSNDEVMSSVIPRPPTLRRIKVLEAHSTKWILLNVLRLPGVKEVKCEWCKDNDIVVSKSFPQLVTELGLTGQRSTLESLELPELSDPSIFPSGPQNPWVNLKSLNLGHVDRLGVQAILSSLTTLERLNLRLIMTTNEDRKNLDKIFTGSKKPGDFNVHRFNDFVTAADESAPSIRKLTLLQSLEIRCDGKFSDWFIVNGLMHLKFLQTLVIVPEDEFSDDAVALLKKNLYYFCRISVQGQKKPRKGKK